MDCRTAKRIETLLQFNICRNLFFTIQILFFNGSVPMDPARIFPDPIPALISEDTWHPGLESCPLKKQIRECAGWPAQNRLTLKTRLIAQYSFLFHI